MEDVPAHADGPTGTAAELMRAAELTELARLAASSDAEAGDGDEAMAALLALSHAASCLSVAQARLIERLARDETTVEAEGLMPGLWLARRARRPRSACRREVTTARTAVAYFSDLLGAVAGGPLTWAHVELLCSVSNGRNRSLLSSVQGELITAADELSFEQWAVLVRQIASEADEDGGYDPNDDLHANRLRISDLPDATRDLSARLVGDTGVVVTATLETIADELFRRYTRDAEVDPAIEVPGRSTLMALALGEACRRARAIDLASTAKPRTEAVIIIDRDERTGCMAATDSRGRTVAPAALDVLLGDAEFRALITNCDRIPLEMGRTQRLATPAQRLAITTRDGGCIFPGCDAPATWCDAHHVEGYSGCARGRTDVDNLALLCRHHHGITHRLGWIMEAVREHRPGVAQGRTCGFVWTTPEGRKLYSQHRPPGRPPRECRTPVPG